MTSVSLEPLSATRSTSVGASLSSRVGVHKDYRIHRSMPLSEPLRGLPPMARPVDASYYPRKARASSPAIPTPPPSSSRSSSSSSSGLYYRQRSESFEAMLLGPSSRVSFSSGSGERRSMSASTLAAPEPETPFDAHLQAVYAGTTDATDGLAFFESHGYYDIDDANTVEMFRQNFGLTDVFWDKTLELRDDDQHVLLVVDDPSAPLGFTSVGTTLYRRHRTVSGRFELVDDDGNPAGDDDDDEKQQRAREARLRAKALELDDDDLRELAQEQAVLLHAISAIRTETLQFQQYFSQAFRDEDAMRFQYAPAAPPALHHAQRTTLPSSSTSATATAVTTTALVAAPPMSVQLPPYCGNVFMLKDTIPYLLRSWHKRWFYLDFAAGLVLMYKRSYWKSPRGVLDLRDVTKVERMNQCDFRLEFRSAAQPTLMLRTKLGEEAELWVNLLRFAKHHVGGGAAPAPGAQQLVQDAAAIDMRSNRLLESKQRKQQTHHFQPHVRRGGFSKGPNQVEMLAMLLSESATPVPSSGASTTSSASSTYSASTVSGRNKTGTATTGTATSSRGARRNSVSTA